MQEFVLMTAMGMAVTEKFFSHKLQLTVISLDWLYMTIRMLM